MSSQNTSTNQEKQTSGRCKGCLATSDFHVMGMYISKIIWTAAWRFLKETKRKITTQLSTY